MKLLIVYLVVILQCILRGSSFRGLHLATFRPSMLQPLSATLSSIKEQLAADMKSAMKAKEKIKLQAIRSVLSAIMQKEVDDRVEVTDKIALEIMSKLIKQRKESIKSFEDGGRMDLAENERTECEVITSYMPSQMSRADIEIAITESIARVGATSVKDMGKVMAELKPILTGKADMSEVGALIRERLSCK